VFAVSPIPEDFNNLNQTYAIYDCEFDHLNIVLEKTNIDEL